jgi:hypothetical protein
MFVPDEPRRDSGNSPVDLAILEGRSNRIKHVYFRTEISYQSFVGELSVFTESLL